MQRLVLLILGSFLLAGQLSAQTGQDSWDNLKQLRVGQKIEVVDMNLKSLKGTFVSYSEEAISLRTDRGEVAVGREDVFRVSARGGKRRRNALIGLGIGAAAGVAGMVIAVEKATNGPVYYDGEGGGLARSGCHVGRGRGSRDWSSLSRPSNDLPSRAAEGPGHPIVDARFSFENSWLKPRAAASA